MHGHIILSHGSDSSPQATKVSTLARVAADMGWSTEVPDYRDCDVRGMAESVTPRIRALVARMRAADAPLLLVGSSMGAFVSALASLEVACAGLFLMALPTRIPGYSRPVDMARGLPSLLIHGYADDVCPAEPTLVFARERGIPCLMVADGHRLAEHLDTVVGQFRVFLEQYTA